MIDTIIIPVLNRLDLLERCLSSIVAETHSPDVIIIDNGGVVPAWLVEDWKRDGVTRGLRDVRVISPGSNLGVATSWNLGVKASPFSRGWLFLNSDAWFDSDQFDQFAADCVEHDFVQAGSPPWCCSYISDDAICLVGLFCERFYPAYMEDLDWQRRARIHGIEPVASSALVHHDNSSTIASDEDLRNRNDHTHQANALFYEYRWNTTMPGGLPRDSEWSLATRRNQAWE